MSDVSERDVSDRRFDVEKESLSRSVPIFGFAGYSGAGKTTLVEQLIPRFVQMGLRVALIKHAHHHFDIDQPGKDSWRHRQAGATEVLLTSGHRWVLMHELRGAPEPTLDEQLARLSPCDLVLIEGFKYAPIPKLEIHRPSNGKPLLFPQDPHIIAIAADEPVPAAAEKGLLTLHLNDTQRIAGFILRSLNIDNEAHR